MGSSSWVITTKYDRSWTVYGDNIIPGDGDQQCAHSNELGGLIGAVAYATEGTK